jgi:hypothetical protein
VEDLTIIIGMNGQQLQGLKKQKPGRLSNHSCMTPEVVQRKLRELLEVTAKQI